MPEVKFDSADSIDLTELAKLAVMEQTGNLRTDVEVLRERVSGLDTRINYEVITRKEIMESTKKDTQWKITLFVTIVLAILALIFKK